MSAKISFHSTDSTRTTDKHQSPWWDHKTKANVNQSHICHYSQFQK